MSGLGPCGGRSPEPGRQRIREPDRRWSRCPRVRRASDRQVRCGGGSGRGRRLRPPGRTPAAFRARPHRPRHRTAGIPPRLTATAASHPPSGGSSGMARWALGVGVPPALVLGWHTAFVRRMRSLATVARLALPLLLIVVAMSAWTTIDRFHSRPEQMGLPTALTVHTDAGLSDPATRALLGRDPQVAATYPGVEVAALVPARRPRSPCAAWAPTRSPTPTPWPTAGARTAATRRWPGRASSTCWTPVSATGCGSRSASSRRSCTSWAAASNRRTPAGSSPPRSTPFARTTRTSPRASTSSACARAPTRTRSPAG